MEQEKSGDGLREAARPLGVYRTGHLPRPPPASAPPGRHRRGGTSRWPHPLRGAGRAILAPRSGPRGSGLSGWRCGTGKTEIAPDTSTPWEPRGTRCPCARGARRPERAREGPAEGSRDRRGGGRRWGAKCSVIARRAAEVISAYVASAGLAVPAPPTPWGATPLHLSR